CIPSSFPSRISESLTGCLFHATKSNQVHLSHLTQPDSPLSLTQPLTEPGFNCSQEAVGRIELPSYDWILPPSN
ncbi:hypothetical protein CEXT_649831, partial [Caerostris extrusa]